jgi:hypothetical protein
MPLHVRDASLFKLINVLILGERVLTATINYDFNCRQSDLNAMAEKVLPHTVLGQMVAEPSLHFIQGKDSPCRLHTRISKATFLENGLSFKFS